MSREYFDWCPHSTFNPMGCGACTPHRERILKLKRVEAFIKNAEESLEGATTSSEEARIVHREWRICIAALKIALAGVV